MLLIVLALVILIALIVGAVWAYHALAATLGGLVAAVLVSLGLAVIAAIPWYVLRARRLPGGAGRGIYQLNGDWGEARLNAATHTVQLRCAGASAHYLFADLVDANASRQSDGGHCVDLEVRDAARPHWQLPVRSAREARCWRRVFRLAVAQRLPG
ncbi:hypothetical protein [Chitinasiproducens palmae]|uniref:Uncharacterized protein n=1 Tax=Chitinasiproducens palmae TaxID=1770053 RepID=A0A1H2PSE9_9BURK|nr:hypothetical protein [Chitinasiproducens palmae]SDV49913.1 hypothetical protein SAMN05216551_109236 [Chitinasiproducens palmae]